MVAASRGGEVEQGRFGGGLGVVVLLVLVVLAVGADDPAFFVALDVDLALLVAPGQSTGGELLNESFIMRAEALEYGYEGAERGAGDHVVGVLAGLQEDGHDDPGGLGRAVRVRAQGAADVLDDLDLGAAGVGKADRLHAALADDVDALAQDPHRGEEGAVDPLAVGVDAVGELVDGLAAFGHEVVAAQPCRPHAVRRDVAAGFQVVQFGVDRGPRQALRVGQGAVGCLGDVQLRGRFGEFGCEGLRFLHPLVERHDGLQVPSGGVFQERGLQQRQAPAPLRLLRCPEGGGGVADLQDVDLEAREDAPLDGLAQPELEQPLAIRAIGVAGHAGDLQLLAVRAPLRAGEARMRGVAVR